MCGLQRLVYPVPRQQPPDGRAFPTRQDDAVGPLNVLGQTRVECVRAEDAEHVNVFLEVALHGDDRDFQFCLHLR